MRKSLKMTIILSGLSFLFWPYTVLAQDITGDWEIQSSVGGTIPITVNCSLIQNGSGISGTCTPVMDNPDTAEVTGSIDADGITATWAYEVFFNGSPGTVQFTADHISATELSGELLLSGNPAPFTAILK